MEFYCAVKYEQINSRNAKSLFQNVKVLHITDFPSDRDMEAAYTEISRALGFLVQQEENPVSGKIKKENWTEITYLPGSEEANTYKHSNTHQPLHTDYCYFPVRMDVTFLFCKKQAAEGGATIFVDGEEVMRLLQEKAPQLLDDLQTHQVRMGRGKSPFASAKVKIIAGDRHGPVLNWNYYRVSPDNPDHILKMRDGFFQFLEQEIVRTHHYLPIRLQPGEAVFVRDDRVLHGREAFRGDRTLLKGAIVTPFWNKAKMRGGLMIRDLLQPILN